MSQKEKNRRQMLSKIFHLAWKLYNKSGRWQYSFGNCLKKAYRLMKASTKRIYSKVRGTTFKNDNGVSRQLLLQRLSCYSDKSVHLELLAEPSNDYDANAIQVLASVRGREKKAVLGYVSASLAVDIRKEATSSSIKDAILFLEDITGTHNHKLGCNFSFII